MYQSKIYGSDKDFLGIVFFGTEQSNTTADFSFIYTLQVSLEIVFKQNGSPSFQMIFQASNKT